MLIFNLETEGLNPATDAIRCYGLLKLPGGDVELRIAGGGGEAALISRLAKRLCQAEAVRGWNVSEFDLWFIQERGALYGIEFPLAETNLIGKYGRPRWTLEGIELRDLADEYESAASELGCEWNLEEIAAVHGWLPATELTGSDVRSAPLVHVAGRCLDVIDAMAFLLAASRAGDERLVDQQSSWLSGYLD